MLDSSSELSTVVVIATYNGAKFIVSELETILFQSEKADRVLIFDDQSTDNTFELVKDFIKSHNLTSWSVKKNESNLGYENNFYSLLSSANEDLIFLCDQDDLWDKDKIRNCKSFFRSHEEACLVCTDNSFQFLTPNTKSKELKTMKFDGSFEKVPLTLNCFKIGRPGCDMVVRRSFFEKIKGYWTNKLAQDEYLWKFAYIEQGLYLLHVNGITRRIHDNNTAKKEGKSKYRNRFGRIAHLKIEEKSLEQLKKYSVCYYPKDLFRLNIIEKYLSFVTKRIKMLSTRNIFIAFRLLFSLKLYTRKKGFAVDVLASLGLLK